MSGRNQHVIPYKDRWAVLGAGNQRITKAFETQREAFERGRQIAKKEQSELLIHGRNSRIRERNSYGNDPFPPRG